MTREITIRLVWRKRTLQGGGEIEELFAGEFRLGAIIEHKGLGWQWNVNSTYLDVADSCPTYEEVKTAAEDEAIRQLAGKEKPRRLTCDWPAPGKMTFLYGVDEVGSMWLSKPGEALWRWSAGNGRKGPLPFYEAEAACKQELKELLGLSDYEVVA